LYSLALDCSARAADAKAANKDTRAFQAFLAAEWDYTMGQSPTWASSLGDRRWNDRWEDVSLAAIDHRHAHDQDALARLKKIDRRKLSSADQLSHDLYSYETELSIEEYGHRGFLIPLNQREGIQN